MGATDPRSDKPEPSEEKQELPIPDAQNLADGEQNITDPALEGLEGLGTQEQAPTMTEMTGQDQTAPENPAAGALRPQLAAPPQPSETEETTGTTESESATANQGQGQPQQQQERLGQQSPAGSTDTR